MRNIIKLGWKRILRKLGIDISRVKDSESNPMMYDNCLRGAISVQRPFNIVQVGANDGKYNDPIYDFVKEHEGHTNIVLVEPIPGVIPYLEENYSYHPSAEVVNKAISSTGSSSMRLYGVDKDYWENIDAGYGQDWPDYRVPTGVTTANRNQLLKWISENVRSDDDPGDIMEEFDVEVIKPDSLINRSQYIDDVHLLQVDAEGLDDDIVYSFFEADIYPNIINIESKHLPRERQQRYNQKLRQEGYEVHDYTSSEKLAII